MTNQKCEQTMDGFLEMDKNSRIPLNITLHLLACKKCRSQVRALTLAERASIAPLHIETPISDKSIVALMRKIDPSYKVAGDKLKPITLRRWIISGIIMILAMSIFTSFNFADNGSLLSVYFYLIFAGVITSYCALFIGSNMDFFIKKFSPIK